MDLDMNQAFQKFLQSMGTAGEYVVMGSVTNTFLNAYDCEQVKITVEGQTWQPDTQSIRVYDEI